MNIMQGIYGGFKLTVSLIPGTDGQIGVELVSKRKDFIDALNAGKIDEKIVRKSFCLPQKDVDEFGFTKFGIERLDGTDEDGFCGFQWWFMFSCLSGCPTQYEYLHFLFNCIDELLRVINQWKDKVNEPQECPDPGEEG